MRCGSQMEGVVAGCREEEEEKGLLPWCPWCRSCTRPIRLSASETAAISAQSDLHRLSGLHSTLCYRHSNTVQRCWSFTDRVKLAPIHGLTDHQIRTHQFCNPTPGGHEFPYFSFTATFATSQSEGSLNEESAFSGIRIHLKVHREEYRRRRREVGRFSSMCSKHRIFVRSGTLQRQGPSPPSDGMEAHNQRSGHPARMLACHGMDDFMYFNLFFN